MRYGAFYSGVAGAISALQLPGYPALHSRVAIIDSTVVGLPYMGFTFFFNFLITLIAMKIRPYILKGSF